MAVLLAWFGSRPPAPAPLEASDFSAERALRDLRLLLDGVGPHPAGTAEARRVRQRLLSVLGREGFSPAVETVTDCWGSRCATLHDVVLHLPGTDPDAPLVLVSTHYDSVGAGPGAADAGAGMASAVELARVLKTEPREHGVLFLWNEGEELGLLGARAFIEHSPWADRVGAVVNLEARGTEGRTYIFEITGPTAPVVEAYQRHASTPSLSTMYTDIYRMLPNGTDAVAYAEAGWTTAGMAFIGGMERYHTPRDDLDHLSPSSVQDLGEQALAMTRGLAGADLDELAEGEDLIAFDVLGLCLLTWPASQNLYLSVALLVSTLSLTGFLVLRKRVPPLHLAVGVGLAVALPAVGVGLAWSTDAVLTGLGASWHGRPWPFRLGIWCLTAVPWLVASARVRPLAPAALAAGPAILLGALAVTLALTLPGGTYLPLLPGGALMLPLGVAALPRPAPTLERAAAVLAALGGVLLLHMALGLEHALGLSGLLVAGPLALGLLSFLPLLREGPGWPGVGLVGGAAVLSLLATLTGPPSTEAHPLGMEALHVQDGNQAWWLARSRTVPRPAALPGTWASDGSTAPLRWRGDVRAAPPVEREPSARATATPTGPRSARLHVLTRGDLHHLWIEVPRGLTLTRIQDRATSLSGRVEWLGDADGQLNLEVSGPLDTLDAMRIITFEPGLPDGAPDTPEGWVPVHRGWLTAQILPVYRAQPSD